MNTTNPEIQNEQHVLPMVKIEIKEECRDEEESPCDDYKFQYTPFDSTEHGNYDDSEVNKIELKEEPSENGCFQSDCMQSTTSFDFQYNTIDSTEHGNNNDSQVYEIECKEEPTEDRCFQSDCMKNTMGFDVPIKKEQLEEQYVLHNHEATSIHYDVLVAPQEVVCKLCERIFKNRYNLFKHNKEHIKIIINKRMDKELISLSHCQYSNRYFKNDGYMQPHLGGVYSIFECELCEKHFKSELNLRSHKLLSHKLNRTPNQVIANSVKCEHCNVQFENRDILYQHVELCHIGKMDEEREYQCVSCKRVYKTKYALTLHVKRCHYDYGRTFECSCGEQFRTPIYLYEHTVSRHSTNGTELYKCQHCDSEFNMKTNLTTHMRNVHCDYSKAYKCWCGKQFRSVIHLGEHISHQHDGKFKNMTKYRVQCELCQTVFKKKSYLIGHMKNIHHDYGETFKCWCGKQFRTPLKLRDHNIRQHERKKPRKAGIFQCDYCQKIFKTKGSVKQHIKNVHYDYGKVFVCWCRRQFRTPRHLRKHKERHEYDIDVNKNKFQCDYCQKLIKTKASLLRHIKKFHYDNQKTLDYLCGKNIEHKNNYRCDRCDKTFKFRTYLIRHLRNVHYNYGTMFECWCGIQFRTPKLLSQHKRRTHSGNIKNINKTNPEVTLPKIVHSEV